LCTSDEQQGKPRSQGKTIYTLTDPCGHCPFRCDKPPFLDEDRAKEIAESLEGGATFYCHQTIDYDRAFEEDGPASGDITGRSRACAGSLITLEKEDRPNQIMRIGERLGLYERDRLNMDAPVFGSMQEWVAAHRRGEVNPDAQYCGVAFDRDCENPPARRIDYRTVPNTDAPACTAECPGCGEPVCGNCLAEQAPDHAGDQYCKGCAQETATEAGDHWTAPRGEYA